MGWSIGYDTSWKRDIGYGVPATCDRPGCGASIDRGLSYVCGGEPYGGDRGCGLYFCSMDLSFGTNSTIDDSDEDLDNLDDSVQLCDRCADGDLPYTPTPDTEEWMRHKLTDPSWGPWRVSNPDEVEALQAALP